MIFEETEEILDIDLDEQGEMEETIHDFYDGCLDRGHCPDCEHFEKCYDIAMKNKRQSLSDELYYSSEYEY